MKRTHIAAPTWYGLFAALAMAVAGTGLGACDDDDPEPTDTGSAPTGAADTTMGGATAATMATEDAGTSAPIDCADATDAAACATAVGPESGEGCTWLAFMDLTIDAGGACSFADSGTGSCHETIGVDDGCDFGDVCDGRQIYFRGSEGSWQLAEGTTCRASQGSLTLCDNSNEDTPPCSCACELPAT